MATQGDGCRVSRERAWLDGVDQQSLWSEEVHRGSRLSWGPDRHDGKATYMTQARDSRANSRLKSVIRHFSGEA